jgi:hypothetical protein
MCEDMTRVGIAPIALLLACSAQVAPEASYDDPLDDAGEADGAPYCTIESIRLTAPFTDLEIPSNVCHDRSATRLAIGESASGELAHPEIGGASIGCALIAGTADVNAPVPVEARVFVVPVTPGTELSFALDGSHATLDLLVAREVRAGVSYAAFVEHGDAIDIADDGGTSHVHLKNGERFIVVRVRPRQLCPGEDHVDFELSVSGAPATDF